MSIELQPLGVACNIGCSYCYQEPMRLGGNEKTPSYDLAAMKRAAEAEGVGLSDGRGGKTSFAIFGGEPLLLPLKDLEELLRWGVEEKGAAPGLQTNASLITDRHMALFKKYRTSVGVSLDGPGVLNRTRRAKDGNDATTDATTAKSQAALERLLDEGMSVSLIVTVCAGNAGTEAELTATIAWLLALRDRGLKYVNLHTLEVDSDAGAQLLLATERSIQVMRRLRRELVGFVAVSPFEDMRKSLVRESGANCVWNFCDPLTTAAVRGIDGQGGRKNCGRTEKQGVSYMKAETTGRERSLLLYLTPQEYGGCQGCRFFAACGGHCPGEGIDGDWRNRTIHCAMLMALFTDLEAELVAAGQTPISQSLRRGAVEAELLGQVSSRSQNSHGDTPHGDEHGDHTDYGGKK
jgi:sulfatase maturation enzyme AslB (radical SAM superfamily)